MYEVDGNFITITGAISLRKSNAGRSGAKGDRIIEGVASTPQRDLHGERVEPIGFDLTYFERHGRLNWDHGKGPDCIIGEPIDWDLNAKRFYLWGRLYEGIKKADDAWALFDAGAELAYSVEGKVMSRDPKDKTHVLTALVINCAVTHNPVNPGTNAKKSQGMAKGALQAGEQGLFRSLGTDAGAALIPESLEDEPARVLERHLAKSVSCGCLQGSDEGMHFAKGYEGAVGHFRLCCGAPVEQAIAMAKSHESVARATGRQLKER